MWHSKVQINSPDVIKEFRVKLLKFNEMAQQSITGIKSDAQRVAQWLRYEQLTYWKQQLRNCEEEVIQCKSALSLARDGQHVYGKNSCVDEQKALKRAMMKKQECERKLEVTKKWLTLLEREAEKQMGPVNKLASALDINIPAATAQLDHLTETLQEYLRMNPEQGGVA